MIMQNDQRFQDEYGAEKRSAVSRGKCIRETYAAEYGNGEVAIDLGRGRMIRQERIDFVISRYFGEWARTSQRIAARSWIGTSGRRVIAAVLPCQVSRLSPVDHQEADSSTEHRRVLRLPIVGRSRNAKRNKKDSRRHSHINMIEQSALKTKRKQVHRGG